MDINECKKQEGLPVKLTLINQDYHFGTYDIIDKSTISFTDRRRKIIPINISMIGLIEPIDKVNYVDDDKGGD